MVGQSTAPRPAAAVSRARRFRPARLRSLAEPGWTPAIVCVLVYLFVVHSFRLPLGATAIGLGLLALALEGRRLQVPTFLLWFAAFLVWAMATLAMGMDAAHSMEQVKEFSKIWLVSFLVGNAARSERQWRILLVGWLAMFALFPFRGTAVNYLLGLSHAGRYAWNFTFQNPNDLAAISLLVFALSIVFVRSPGSAFVRWSARTGALSLPLLILLTGSRGALLALGVFAAVMVMFSRRRIGTIAMLLAAGIVALPLLPQNLQQRFSNMKFLTSTETLRQADTSAEQRFAILQVAATVARDHPLFGVGIGNYPLANFTYAQRREEWWRARGFRDSHNSYLTIAAETGIPGLLLMAAAVASVLLSLLRAQREGKRLAVICPDPVLREALINRPPALIAGLLAFLVTGIFGSLMYFTYPFLYAVVAQSLAQFSLERARRLRPSWPSESVDHGSGAAQAAAARPRRPALRPRVAWRHVS
jgi:O-antigen ligase